jgi:hypothetical protein
MGMYEAFKKGDHPSQWYSAFLSAVKASVGFLRDYPTDKKEATDIRANPTEFYFVQPLVILDGILASAELTIDNQIEIIEVQSAAFNFEYKTKSYSNISYRVDVVTLSALKEYLKIVSQRQEDFLEGLQSNVSFDFDPI